MSGLPSEAVERLRETLAAAPDVVRATWQSADGARLVVALDGGVDDDWYRGRAGELSRVVLPIVAKYSAGLVCGPEHGVASSARGGLVLYERAGS